VARRVARQLAETARRSVDRGQWDKATLGFPGSHLRRADGATHTNSGIQSTFHACIGRGPLPTNADRRSMVGDDDQLGAGESGGFGRVVLYAKSWCLAADRELIGKAMTAVLRPSRLSGL